MTVLQIYEAVLIELNKVKAPSMSLSDFIYFFNKGVLQYINSIYNQYEIKQLAVDDLRVLRGTAVFENNSTKTEIQQDSFYKIDGEYFVYLPDDYWHILNCVIELKTTSKNKCKKEGTTFRTGVKRLTSNQNPQVINNFYLKPSYKNPYFYINNNNVGNSISSLDSQLNIDTVKSVYKISSFTGQTQFYFSFIEGSRILIDAEDILSLYRSLLKIKNGIYRGLSTDEMKLFYDMKIDLIDDSYIKISSLNLDDSSNNGVLSNNSSIISTEPYINFFTERESGVRYGNRSKVRMELKIGEGRSVEPVRLFVDYLKAPLYINITLELIDDIEDNSQILEFPDYVVYEIINRIVTLVMENGGNPRLQNQVQINNTIPQVASGQ